jgi:hypothetical protein
VVAWIKGGSVLIASDGAARVLLLLLGAVVAGAAKGLPVVLVPEQGEVSTVGEDVVHDGGAGAVTPLEAEQAVFVDLEIGVGFSAPFGIVEAGSPKGARVHRRSTSSELRLATQ